MCLWTGAWRWFGGAGIPTSDLPTRVGRMINDAKAARMCVSSSLSFMREMCTLVGGAWGVIANRFSAELVQMCDRERM